MLVAAAPARAETLAREAAEAAKAADAAKKAAAAAARETASLTASLRKLNIAQGPRRRRTRVRRQGARRRTRRTRPRRRPRSGSRRPRPRPRKRGSSSTPQRPMRSRSPTPPPQRTPLKAGRGQEGRHRKGGARCETRARAGLDLHQPRDAEALRAAQHAQAVAGRRRSVRFEHRGSGHDPQSREADRHACVHRDGAQRRRPSLEPR